MPTRAVLTALNARATDSCSPAKANAVVRAVGNLLDNPQIVRPSVKYIVVVGDDAAGIPFGRVLDNSAYANERGYASTFFGATNNQYLSTYGLGFLPTDDPLGDVNYSGKGPYVPELAVGRLVETPTQILSQITQYINPQRRDQPHAGSDDRLRLPQRTARRRSPRTSRPRWGRTTRRS